MTDVDAMMAAWAEANAPGPEHEKFKDAVGTWKTECKMWMGPGEPQVSQGTSTMELVFGGRYLKEQYSSPMGDHPFEGLCYVGYDNMKKKHVQFWIDTMSTGFTIMEGDRDPETGHIVTHGECMEPGSGPVKTRHVLREVSRDEHVLEMYRTVPQVGECKCMEITYTRQ